MIVTDQLHFVRVSVKDTVIMGLMILAEDLVQLFRRFITICCARLFGHFDASVRHKRTLQRLICLQAYDSFELLSAFTNISRAISRKTRNHFRLHIEHSAFGAFFLLESFQDSPQFVGGCCRTCKKVFVAIVSGVVVLNKVTDIHLICPFGSFEPSPLLFHRDTFCLMIKSALRHSLSVLNLNFAAKILLFFHNCNTYK